MRTFGVGLCDIVRHSWENILKGRKLALQMNLATVAVLHTAMALEDPFDNQGLDGIYVDEALFEAEQVTHCAL